MKLRVLLMVSLFIALNILLTRLVAPIQLQFVRISFGFLPIALASILFGPVAGAVTGVIGDILGWMLKPMGPFFPGFTLSAMISGAIYGFFFYKKTISIQRIVLAVITSVLVVDLCLNTIWLSILYKKAVAAFISARLIKAAIMLPIETVIIYYFNQVLRRVGLKTVEE